MTAATAQPPARPGFNPAELFEPDRRDWLRLLGGVLLAAGCIVLYIRKFQPWADFPLFLVALVPFVVLYGLGWLGGLRDRAAARAGAGPGAGAAAPAGEGPGATAGAMARPEGWQIVFLILGALLAGVVMAQLILLLGADDLEGSGHQALIAGAVAAAAYAASFLRRVPALALIGGVAALWAWLSLWDKIIGIEDSISTARALLLIFAVLMLAAAFALRTMDWAQAADFISVAGVAAIIAGILSISSFAQGLSPVSDSDAKPTEVWNVFILVVSLALIAYGARAPSRGPSYVGAIGLVAFVGLTGSNLVALASGHSDDREKLAGWPLLLVLLGIAGLVASFFMPREGAGGGGPTTAPAGVPGAPRPGAGWGPGAPGQPGPGGYPPPGQQAPPPGAGGYPPPGQQAPPPQAPPPQTQQYPQQPPPGQPPPAPQPPAQQPPGDATVARPIPPADDRTVARPVPPEQPQQDRPTDPGHGQPPRPG